MKVKKIPMRRCVGCMESKPKKELIRIVCNKEGEIRIDETGKAQGRGVYLCLNSDCFALAKKKKAIARNLEREIPEEKLEELFIQLEAYAKKDS